MIFLDTGYFRGLMDVKDDHHEDALKVKDYLDDINEITVINTTVLVEILNRTVGSPINVRSVYDNIHQDNEVIYLTYEDYLKSLDINNWYGNSINYSDCTILKTMMDMGINRIVSFDDDFKNIEGYDVISGMWRVISMDIDYEIENEKLKRMVENKARQLKIPVNQLISNYINRGLMGDCCNEDTFKKLHSDKFLKDVDEALDVD